MKLPFSIFDFQRDLLRATRKDRSQAWLARAWDVSENQLSRLENGRAIMSFAKFAELSGVHGRDLREAFEFLVVQALPQSYDLKMILNLLLSSQKPATAAAVLGVSRHTFGRWLAGSSEPNLEELFMLLYHLRTAAFVSFVARLIPNGTFPSLQSILEKEADEIQLTYQNPNVALLLRIMETRAYEQEEVARQEVGFLAKKMGLPAPAVLVMLENLKKAGVVLLTPEGKWRIDSVHGVDTRTDFASNRRLLLYWQQIGTQRLQKMEKPMADEIYGHNVFSLTEKDFSKVKEAYIRFFETVRTIVSQSKDQPERVMTMTVSIFDPTLAHAETEMETATELDH